MRRSLAAKRMNEARAGLGETANGAARERKALGMGKLGEGSSAASLVRDRRPLAVDLFGVALLG